MKKYNCPVLARYLLRIFTDYQNRFAIVGDLEEAYREIRAEQGRFRSWLWYWKQCLGALPKFISYKTKWTVVMFNSAAKIAVRNIKRQKGYSFINLFGLSVGMACSLLIALWVQTQLSYDKFHDNGDRIYRAATAWDSGFETLNSSWRLGPAFVDMYPEVETFSRVWPWHTSMIRIEEKSIMENDFYLVDPDFFTMFSFQFIQGDPETVLSNLNSIAVSEAASKRWFGDTNPIGKTVFVVRENKEFIISGVFKNPPWNSHLQFDVVGRIDLMPDTRFQSWSFVAYTYMMLREGTDSDQFNEKIKDFYREVVNTQSTSTPVFYSLEDLYLYKMNSGSRIEQVYMFSVIALLILILACINFMNLSTARSVRRAKEVGLRKVCGAGRSQIIKQFLSESLIFTLFAFILSIGLLVLILPFYHNYTGQTIDILSAITLKNVSILFTVVLLIGFFAGSYPALYMSRFSPFSILKMSNVFSGSSRSGLRSTLIILQFSVSIILIVSTIIVSRQIEYIQKKNSGIERDMIVMFRMPSDANFRERYDLFKQILSRDNKIINVSASMGRLVDTGTMIGTRLEHKPEDDLVGTNYTTVDYDYINTFGIELAQGRVFSKDFAVDETTSCIINETAANALGLESAVGTELFFNHPEMPDYFRHVKVIGVVKDFHHASMHTPIGPYLMRVHKPWFTHIFVKIDQKDISGALGKIEDVLYQFVPDYPFEYLFLDDYYMGMYDNEIKTGKLFKTFAILAIIISCLGIFGLAMYSVEQKTKEIGVRKILGASESKLVYLLTREFSILVLIANCIALPAGYLIMERWLQDFAYRTSITWSAFVLSIIISLAIAFMTVCYQALKAARANPVDSLRYE